MTYATTLSTALLGAALAVAVALLLIVPGVAGSGDGGMASTPVTSAPPDAGQRAAEPAPSRSLSRLTSTVPDEHPLSDAETVHLAAPFTRADIRFDPSESDVRSPGACRFFRASSHYLEAADTPEIRAGTDGFAIAAWVRISSAEGEEHTIVAKDTDAPAESRDFTLAITHAGHRLRPKFYINGGDAGVADHAGSMVAETWHFVLAWWDAAAGTVNVRLDQRSTTTVDVGATVPHQSTAPFRIGARAYAGFLDHFNGSIGPVAMFKAPPGGIGAVIESIGDRLYNNGDGLHFAQVTAQEKAEWALAHWWGLDENGNERQARHGPITLTAVNGPVAVVGHVRDGAGVPATHMGPAFRAGDWQIPFGTPMATWRHFGAELRHAADRIGFRRVDASLFPGTSWELGLRTHTAVRPGMDEVELCRTVAADGTVARIVIDSEGRPSYRNTGPGGTGEVVATCPTPLYGLLNVTGGETYAGGRMLSNHSHFATLNLPRRTVCRLYVDALGDVGIGDIAHIRGCGVPFDGEHLLTIAFDDPAGGPGYVEFLVLDEDEKLIGLTPRLGEIIPTGEFEEPTAGAYHPYGSEHEYMRRRVRPAALRVRRSASAITLFHAGIGALGSASPAGLPAGPSSAGAIATIGGSGSNGPLSLPSLVESFAAPLSAADALALDFRLCARVVGAVDYAGNACSVDIESAPGMKRRQSQLHDFMILFTDQNNKLLPGPVDAHTGDRYGIGYGDFSSCDLGHEDQQEETHYRAHVALFGKRWSTTGALLPPSLIGVATVAEITRRPWLRTVHVDGDTGNNATGTGSEEAPVQTLTEAIARSVPGTIIRCRSTGMFGEPLALPHARGPLMVTTWGAGRAQFFPGWSSYAFDLAQSHHVTLKRVAAVNHNHGDGGYAFTLFLTTGLLVKDVVVNPDSAHARHEGWGIYGGAASYCTFHDLDIRGAHAGHQLFMIGGCRTTSFRRLDFQRQGTSHTIRMVAGDAVEYGGIKTVHVPEHALSATGFSLRAAPRRHTAFDCDFSDRHFGFGDHVEFPYLNGGQVSDGTLYDVAPHRITVLRCRAGYSPVHASGGSRHAQNLATAGQLATYPVGADGAWNRTYPIVIEGNRWITESLPVPTGPILAAPTAGPNRNIATPTADSGESLWSPSALPLPAPAGWVVLAADGLPQGGVGWRTSAWEIGGIAVAGTFAPSLALPLPAGTYEYQLDVVDTAGTTAPSRGVTTVTVDGDGP